MQKQHRTTTGLPTTCSLYAELILSLHRLKWQLTGLWVETFYFVCTPYIGTAVV